MPKRLGGVHLPSLHRLDARTYDLGHVSPFVYRQPKDGNAERAEEVRDIRITTEELRQRH